MGSGGVPSGGVTVEIVEGRRLESRVEKPNSRYDLIKNGKKIQSRWYDWEGKAIRNRDYEHDNSHNNHTFPHDHEWKWNGEEGTRIPDNLNPDYDKFY